MTLVNGVVDADPRARAAALLSRYPELSGEELGELEHWFRKQATALDVGLLASDPAVATQFRAYRNRHHDRFTLRDMLIAAAFIGVAVAAVGAMLLL